MSATKTINATTMKKKADKKAISVGLQGGDIPFIPPVVTLGLVSAAALLTKYVGNLPFLSHSNAALVARVFQFAFAVIVSYKVNVLSRQELERAKSGVRFTPVLGLATQGEVYSRSRNPLYVILLWLMASLAVLVNSTWFVAATIMMWMYLEYLVIPVEESFLAKRFGREYEAYCLKTPRWLGASSSGTPRRL